MEGDRRQRMTREDGRQGARGEDERVAHEARAGEFVNRLAPALRALLECLPRFDQYKTEPHRILGWESAEYQAAKEGAWAAIEEVRAAGLDSPGPDRVGGSDSRPDGAMAPDAERGSEWEAKSAPANTEEGGWVPGLRLVHSEPAGWRARRVVEWRAVAGYEGSYEVSGSGQVRNVRSGRELKRAGKNPHVALWKGGRSRTVRVAEMVAAAFLPPRPVGHVLKVKNGDWRDVRVVNLKWVAFS